MCNHIFDRYAAEILHINFVLSGGYLIYPPVPTYVCMGGIVVHDSSCSDYICQWDRSHSRWVIPLLADGYEHSISHLLVGTRYGAIE
jgi:hypothetical protein